MTLDTESKLAALCIALIDGSANLSAAERELKKSADFSTLTAERVVEARASIKDGRDPLGDWFTAIRSAAHRRAAGAVYTPQPIVDSMTAWLQSQAKPQRVVDPGAGSGRFILAAGRAFPKTHLVAVEMDPLAALMLRANLEASGLGRRSTVLVQDFREVRLPAIDGVTAFIGNPPYVRHHNIADKWKKWYAARFAGMGIRASALAGLHLHFFLQTRLLCQADDIGAFITSAEWLDVNYGSALRGLVMDELGGMALHVLEPKVEAFPGTATTAAITCFRVGKRAKIVRVRAVEELAQLNGLSKGTKIDANRMRAAPRWSAIIRPSLADETQADGPELGELFRVHRGQVTGANSVWIAGEHAESLPESVRVPSVTKARDLILAGDKLESAQALRRVIDLPVDLDTFGATERIHIDAFLKWARKQGAHHSYIAQHRKAWWSVGLKAPAPILCTYMGRRPPQFTLNSCGARHINIAHGLYPREQLPARALQRLVDWLNNNTTTSSGRTYAGGLTKFEPKEVERLHIPSLEALNR